MTPRFVALILLVGALLTSGCNRAGGSASQPQGSLGTSGAGSGAGQIQRSLLLVLVNHSAADLAISSVEEIDIFGVPAVVAGPFVVPIGGVYPLDCGMNPRSVTVHAVGLADVKLTSGVDYQPGDVKVGWEYR